MKREEKEKRLKKQRELNKGPYERNMDPRKLKSLKDETENTMKEISHIVNGLPR